MQKKKNVYNKIDRTRSRPMAMTDSILEPRLVMYWNMVRTVLWKFGTSSFGQVCEVTIDYILDKYYFTADQSQIEIIDNPCQISFRYFSLHEEVTFD